MSHTIHEKTKLLSRVRRIRGQIEAVERALEGEAGCDEILHLIAGIRGSTSGLMTALVEDHIRTHLVDDKKYPDALDQDATEQLLEIIRSYLK